AAREMRDRIVDRPLPFEAEVAVAGLDRQPRHLRRREPRAMQIELRVAKPVRPANRPLDQLRPEHVAIERVRALPVGDVDHAMTETDGKRHVGLCRHHTIILQYYTRAQWRAAGEDSGGAMTPVGVWLQPRCPATHRQPRQPRSISSWRVSSSALAS